MRKLKNQTVIRELKRIGDRHGGIIKPEQVVAAAQPVNSPLHNYFDWDDDEAASAWRIHQARQLLSICVEYVGSENSGRETKVFVSLKSDRAAEGGYRTLVNVLQNENLRDQLLLDAMESMAFFREKFQQLRELGMVFKAMAQVHNRVARKRSK